MSQPIQIAFHLKLEELKKVIERDNTVGNPNGLFSQYVLSPGTDLLWDVCINKDWLDQHKDTMEQGNYIQLAILGYSLFAGERQSRFIKAFISGLKRLKSKDPFPGDRISFPFYPREFLGLTLGIGCLESEEQEEQRKWLADILFQRKSMNIVNPLHRIMYNIIETVLSRGSVEIGSRDIAQIQSYGEFCLLYWGAKRGAFRLNSSEAIHTVRKRILEDFLDEDIPSEQWLTPVIYFSTKSCLLESLDPTVLSPDHVTRLLNNFESAMRRWPWSEKKKWPIIDEKDVQSILWLILRSAFDDIVDEEPTMKLGHGYSLADFRIPSLKLLVEAKFARKKEDFSKIENEIKIDSINYLKTTDCKDMIVFIYDDSASVEEHQITIQALKKINGIKDVIIASKPSHIH